MIRYYEFYKDRRKVWTAVLVIYQEEVIKAISRKHYLQNHQGMNLYTVIHVDIQLYINSVKGQNQKCQIHRVILVILDRKEMEEYLVCQGQVHFQQLIHNLNDMHLHVFRFVIVRFRELKTFSQKKKEVILNRLEVEDQLNQPNQLNHLNRQNQSNQIEEDRLNQDHQIKTNYKISLQNLFFQDRNI